MSSRRKLLHVGPDLCKHLFRSSPPNTGDRVQQVQVFLKREHALLDLFIQSGNFFVEKVDMPQLRRQYPLLVLLHQPMQSPLQVRFLGFHPPLRQFRQDFGVLFSPNHRFQYRTPRFAKDV